MYNLKLVLAFVAATVFFSKGVHAQLGGEATANRDEPAITIALGAGPTLFTGKAGTPAGLSSTIDRSHLLTSLRVMWHPGYLLRMGIETGYSTFYSYETTNGTKIGQTSVRAVPILFLLSMPLGSRINLYTGAGSYLVTTRLRYDSEVRSSANSLGWVFAANYLQPISRRMGLALEAKYLDATGTKDAILTGQLLLRYTIKSR